jgi:CRISPR-associated protein Cmr6
MNTPNIGWLYFKDYLRINGNPTKLFFERIKWEQEEKEKKNDAKSKNFDRFFNGFKDDDGDYHSGKNQTILELEFNKSISDGLSVVSPKEKLRFKTTYPGLTLGTGYTHEINETGEFKLGFFFDHTTGYPCIPGSTVKGCLRGMFPQKERKEVANKDEKYNYLASVIRELPTISDEKIRDNKLGLDFDPEKHNEGKQFIDFLEHEIFDSEKPERNEDGEFVFQPLCVYERDIFFDAYLGSTHHPAIIRSTYQNQRPFIGDDYITPHINRKKPELSPFTNPVPLMFLKILPEVTIQFQFDLKPGLLTTEQKEELFRRLLLDFGLGAKTNVGYGQFDLILDKNRTNPEPPENSFPLKAIPFLIKGQEFVGKVTEQIGEWYMIHFNVNDIECIIRKMPNDKLKLKIGDTVKIICSNNYTSANHNISVKNY